MKPTPTKLKTKSRVTREGKLLGGYVPKPVVQAIEAWVSEDPERDVSQFIRQAAREKLIRDGFPFSERNEAPLIPTSR